MAFRNLLLCLLFALISAASGKTCTPAYYLQVFGHTKDAKSICYRPHNLKVEYSKENTQGSTYWYKPIQSKCNMDWQGVKYYSLRLTKWKPYTAKGEIWISFSKGNSCYSSPIKIRKAPKPKGAGPFIGAVFKSGTGNKDSCEAMTLWLPAKIKLLLVTSTCKQYWSPLEIRACNQRWSPPGSEKCGTVTYDKWETPETVYTAFPRVFADKETTPIDREEDSSPWYDTQVKDEFSLEAEAEDGESFLI